MTEVAISIRNLTVVRGVRPILSALDLDIQSGCITGLLGPSGCGKTTLMRAIVGVQRIAGGTVRVLGEEAGRPTLRTRVAYVTQSPSIYGDLSVRENLRYFARVLRLPASAADRAIAAVGLRGFENQVGQRLSGGEKSRLSLATALLGSPELLVLDEPTVGLDPVLRQELWTLFRDLAAEGRTLLVSSHVMDEAERCNRLILMRDGSVIAHEEPAALRERTHASTVEAAFLTLVAGKEASQ